MLQFIPTVSLLLLLLLVLLTPSMWALLASLACGLEGFPMPHLLQDHINHLQVTDYQILSRIVRQNTPIICSHPSLKNTAKKNTFFRVPPNLSSVTNRLKWPNLVEKQVSCPSRIVSIRDYVCQGSCLSGIMSVREYVYQGLCLSGTMFIRDYVCQGLCLSGIMSVRDHACRGSVYRAQIRYQLGYT